MKKIVSVFAAMIAMVASVTVVAKVRKDSGCAYHHAIPVAVQGKHCTGTVGCGCTGFAPITNGEVWQQAYCKYCGHNRSCHR